MSDSLLPTTNDKQPSLRVAIIGHRGIPNAYGGFETLAEELTKCLVSLGCAVTVYCRTQYFKEKIPTYCGADLIYLSTIKSKHLDTFFHTFKSVLHIVFKNTADIVIIVNVGNVFSAMLAKLFNKKVILCVDGLDWERRKWGVVARGYLKMCSYFVKFAATEVVTDAASVHAFYKRERKVKSTHIPYGTNISINNDGASNELKKLGLKTKAYFLYVARFEPENNPLLTIEAYIRSGVKIPLVMVGDNRYNPEFVAKIKAAANERVVFLGYVFGQRYKQLMKNALAYVRVAEVGGASPAVIEAMGQATCVIANDKSENREMISDTGFLYPLNTQQLSIVFRDVAADPARAVELGKKAAQRAMLLYGWDTIAYDYYRLIKKLAHEKVYIPKKQNVMEPGGYERKRILITGSAGVLGTELYKHFKTNFSVCASTLKPRESWQVALDITNTVACERLVAEFKPDYIIHAAALTDLEKCEQNLSDAYASNTQPVKILAQLASRYHAKFIFVSTANVFNGEKKIYNEYDEPTPINVYGLTKHMGELMTAYYSHNYLIIRLGWLVGGGPTLDKKFVAKIVEQLSSGSRELHVVSDKFGTISYAPDVVRMLQYLLEKNSTGVYHIAATGITSRFKMAEFIVNTLGYEGKVVVTPVKSLYFSNIFPTPRPHYECLVSARLHREGVEVLHTWEVALEEYLGEYFKYAYRKKPNRSVRLRSVGAKS